MRSASETGYRKTIANKLSILIFLWILDKIVMLIMFFMFR